MKEERLLKRAKIQLLKRSCFFASIALGLKHKVSKTIETACTDGLTIWYGLNFLRNLTDSELLGLMAHEVLHVVFLHHTRRGNRDPGLWNVACDYAINIILLEAGYDLPEGGLIDDAYKGMSAEKIYDQLFGQNPNKGDSNIQDMVEAATGFGEVTDVTTDQASSLTKSQQIAAAERKQMQRNMAAAAGAKQQGDNTIVNAVNRTLFDLVEPKVNWKAALHSYAEEIARNDYTWSKPNTRYSSCDFIMPRLENKILGDIGVIIDNSGSIDDELCVDFLSEMQGIMVMTGAKVKLLCVDTDVNLEQELEPDEIPEIKDGGGTCYIPGFKRFEETHPALKVIIYFTDGYCSSFPEEAPQANVIWMVYRNRNFKPPFGDTVFMQQD